MDNSINGFKCDYCNKILSTKFTLKRHKFLKHNLEIETNLENNSSEINSEYNSESNIIYDNNLKTINSKCNKIINMNTKLQNEFESLNENLFNSLNKIYNAITLICEKNKIDLTDLDIDFNEADENLSD